MFARTPMVVIAAVALLSGLSWAGQPSPQPVEIYTPAVEIGSSFGYFVCLVFNVSTRELHGTAELINTSDPFPGTTLTAWTLPPKGVFPLIIQWPDAEVFHSLASHVTSTDAQRGDLLITHCGANSGLQCQSTVTAQ